MSVDFEKLRSNLSDSAFINVKKWLDEPKYEEYRDEINQLIAGENWQQLEDSFFKVLEFGTAGRRGATGVGPNRINKVTIGESAQALCTYVKNIDQNAEKQGVVIAYDTRLTSPELSDYVARVCVANGFKVYLFDGYRSTPELSFAVLYLKTAIGIVVSASHNPPIDNGFKAYWSDGGQILSPHDKGVLEIASKIDSIAVMDLKQAVDQGLLEYIGQDVDEAYIKTVVDQSLGDARDLSIVYSPLHGTGQRNTLPVLRQAGFKDIHLVEEQMTPDGHFPSIPSGKPNPEEQSANAMAVELMHKLNADIALTNDPDADRIGVMVPAGDDTIYLSGNQSVILATEYCLRRLKEQGNLTPKHFIVKTVVTTQMLSAIADRYGVECVSDLLIGFKYIAEAINSKVAEGKQFIIAAEESFGMLVGDYARDKDGASGALILAEYAAELKKANKTLYERLLELYAEYGIYRERLDTIAFSGADGFSKMQGIMDSIRNNPPQSVGGYLTKALHDYKSLTTSQIDGTVTQPINSPSTNMVILDFEPGCRIAIRPSGTEPKIKLYIQWRGESEGDIDKSIKNTDKIMQDLAETFKKQYI